MGCPSCGAENPFGARFCNSCGAPQTAVCPDCGNGNPPASRFCNACGSSLGATSSPAHDETAPPPQAYTPRHLAEKILAGRDALTGERKQVTVLFADIVGSTELIRDRDPEEAQRLLDGAVERMMAAVHRYEGTVSRLQGDGLMAMFGAPVAHEDHAVRACYAALAMLESVRSYAEEVRQEHGAVVEMRVGINSGEVIVRLISDDLHMDYTAMGEMVHLAARIEGLARAGTALLSATTLALVEGFVEARPLGPTPVRGFDQPVDVYELFGAGAARTRLQASAARGLSRFVGRQHELEVVRTALERAGAGHGQVVALVGEPGIGKSRLVHEATQAPGAAGWLVLQSGAVSYGTATTYLPLIDLLKAYGRIEPSDDAHTAHEKLAGRLLALDRGLAAILPPLLALLDLPTHDPGWADLDPAHRRRATLDALQRLFLRESQEQPLLLVFEDLHWIDSETQALLDALVEALPTARILLLVNYRPEYTHAWGNKSAYTRLRIDPLEEGSADRLLEALLGSDASVEPLKPLLVERTEGNPFFLEESVRALVESGALAGERGAYRLVRPVESIRVPATVQAVLSARIDRLPPDEKRLLQTAAVIGKDVPFAILRAIADTPDVDLHAAVSHLQAAEMLHAVSLFPEPQYTLEHALTHDVAYGSLLQERRRELHARIVGAIERLYPDRLAEHVERLAHHALRAEVWEPAADYSHQAGNRARMRSAFRAAAVHLEQALAALKHVAATRDRTEQGIDIRLGLRSALRLLGEHERIPELLQEAQSLADSLGDRRRLAFATYGLSNFYFHNGQHLEAIEASQRVVAAADALGDAQLALLGHVGVALPRACLGEYRYAANHLLQGVAALDKDQLGERPVESTGSDGIVSLAWVAWCLAELGEFDEGSRYGEQAIRLAEEAGLPYPLLVVLNRSAMLTLLRGDTTRLVPRLERALDLVHTQDMPWYAVQTRLRLGAAYMQAGRLDDALPLFERTAELVIAGQADAQQAPFATFVAEGYARSGRLDAAADMADRAFTLATTRGERGNAAWARRMQAEIAAHRDRPDSQEAVARYRDALALAEELGMRPLQAHCHLGLGTLHRRMGRPDGARAELATAVAMLREMGMAFWLPEAERELAGASG